jgi:NitT/TauT family transport system substrate-binding protein
MYRSFVTLVSFVVIMAGCVTGGAAAEQVKFSLDWVISGRHAGYYVALEKGWWKAKGLDVELSRGFGSIDTTKRVATGSADYGFADAGTVIISRANGTNLKMLGVFYSKAPFVVIAWKQSNIRGPKDLEGKTIGEARASAGRTVFPALAKANGVDLSKVNWQNMSPAAKNPSLLARKVDAILQYAFEKKYFDVLTQQGKGPFHSWYYADFGLNVYGNGLVASDKMIAAKPAVIRALTEGAARGNAFAVSNPKETVAIVSKHQPLLKKATIAQEVEVLKELIMTPEAKVHGAGWMTEEKIKATRDIMCAAQSCKKLPPVKDLYTNQFLPRK